MYLAISEKLRLLLGETIAAKNNYLVIYSDTNWAILSYWGKGAFSFNPQEEFDDLYDVLEEFIKADGGPNVLQNRS